MDKPIRSIVKTLSWRLIAFVATAIGIYIYNGELMGSIIVALIINLIKMFLYYFHERSWNKISFGRIEFKPPEYNI